jgi:hypothetical protein
MLTQGQIGSTIEKIIEPYPWEGMSDEKTLSSLPGTEEKVGFLG